MHFTETSCSLLKNAEAQTFDKQVSDPIAMDGLSGEEIIHVDSGIVYSIGFYVYPFSQCVILCLLHYCE